MSQAPTQTPSPQTQPQTQIQPRPKYEPLAKPGGGNGLKALLEAQAASIAKVLPKHITAERLIKTLLVAANRLPLILECTQQSICETINRAAELGLDLSGTLGEAYPVPFNNKVKTPDGREMWVMQLQLIIGYRGMEKLAWQSGQVSIIDAEVVRANDHFVFAKGLEQKLEWRPCLTGDRGDPIGAYAVVKMKDGGSLFRFLPVSDIEKIRAASKSKDSPAWRNWWDEMARKCALKRTLKDAPLSTEKLTAVLEHDNEDLDLSEVLEVSRDATRSPANRRLAERRQAALTGELQAPADYDPDAGLQRAADSLNNPPTEEEAERILQAAADKSQAEQSPAAPAVQSTQAPAQEHPAQQGGQASLSLTASEPRPVMAATIDTPEKFIEFANGCAMESNVAPAKVMESITKAAKRINKTLENVTVAMRQKWATAMRDGQWDWDRGGNVQ